MNSRCKFNEKGHKCPLLKLFGLPEWDGKCKIRYIKHDPYTQEIHYPCVVPSNYSDRWVKYKKLNDLITALED